MKIELNNKNDNPFYGLRACLELFQRTGGIISESMLNAAYNEVKDNKEKREMFFSLLFSVGDISARQHNIFKGKKKDNGGNSNRESFYISINWLIKTDYKQFLKFLNSGLFNEYTCFDHLFRNRVKTNGTNVIETYDMFSNEQYRIDLSEYLYKVINGNNPFDKLLIAKFLTLPRLTKRSKSKKMLDVTKTLMGNKVKFLSQLSELMRWEYVVNGNYTNFVGYRKWRKDYNQDLESVLFSSGKIKEFDQEQFLSWFDKLPAQARFRVKNRILYKRVDDKNLESALKYPDQAKWYSVWEQYKLEKQAEQRKLEEKVRQGTASNEDQEKLKQVKKEAKVTVGATSFNEIYTDILNGRIDKLKVESFINKINLPYNSLVIMDDSGSMSGAPFNFASFLASVCLVKNPDDDGRNLLGFFNNSSRLYGYINAKATKTPNSLLRTQTTTILNQPFVNPEMSFFDNYQRISSFCNAVFQSGGTNISSIPEGFKQCCDVDPSVLDALKNYPIWTIISDGEWNNLYSPEASINDFMRKCEKYFGYRPFIVAIDIDRHSRAKVDRFSGIDNMIYIPSNPAQIEQFLTNFRDMDIFDVYTPLQSIFRSNRYELVRLNTI